MAKLNSAEETIIEQIDKWKADDPAFVTRITHTLSQPLVWAADKFIPDDVKGGLGKLTEGIANQIQNLSINYLSAIPRPKFMGAQPDKSAHFRSLIRDLQFNSQRVVLQIGDRFG